MQRLRGVVVLVGFLLVVAACGIKGPPRPPEPPPPPAPEEPVPPVPPSDVDAGT